MSLAPSRLLGALGLFGVLALVVACDGGSPGSDGSDGGAAGADIGIVGEGGAAPGGAAGSGPGAGFGGSAGDENAHGGAGGAGGSADSGYSGQAGTSGGTAGSGGLPMPTEAPTVYLAGDSTVQTYRDTSDPRDQAGWGQMLPAHLHRRVLVENRAIGGRTARRFIDEGRLSEIAEALEPGDYLFVQFGTNDGNRNATYTIDGQTIPYYLDPATDFKRYLEAYIDSAREHEATPVLVTPPPRSSAYCTGGNGTAAHAAAMRELAAEKQVALVDLNAMTVAHLRAICPAPVPETFFLLRPDGSVDGTHFQENGARLLAGFVADGIRSTALPLARFLIAP